MKISLEQRRAVEFHGDASYDKLIDVRIGLNYLFGLVGRDIGRMEARIKKILFFKRCFEELRRSWLRLVALHGETVRTISRLFILAFLNN